MGAARRIQTATGRFAVSYHLSANHGEGTAEKLHIAKIDPKEVLLKPRLVGIEMK